MKKKIVEMMGSLGIPKEAIDAQMNSIATMLDGFKDFKKLRPLTIKELEGMSQKELDQVYSLCWKEGRQRCSIIGITDLKIEKASEPDHFDISWSDGNGDPHVDWLLRTEKINKVGDGYWDYGLYVKK